MLEAVQKQLGVAPNLFRLVANSPAALDAQIVEIVQHVALNTWTNYINEVAQTEIDFPAVEALAA